MRARLGRRGLLLGGLLIAACLDDPTILPPVSYIQLSPHDTLIAPADTIRFAATPIGLDGEPVQVPLTYQVDDPRVGVVDSVGVFVATGEGWATVTVTEIGGVRALSTVNVGPIAAFSPANSAFGGVVTLEGAGFGPTSRVEFGATPGQVREVSADGRTLSAWVPWDAENGPINVGLADGRRVPTPAPFFLTGGADDALEPNDIDVPTAIEFPFRNPYLAARLTSMDTYRLTVLEPTALTVRVSDREAVNDWQRRLVVQLSRDAGVGEFVGLAPVWAFARDERQDGVISRTQLEPGTFRLFVFIGPSNLAVDRRYELSVEPVADFALVLDAAEPDDAPFEAPTIETPFQGSFALENPWSTDYYGLDVTTRSRVHVQATVPGSAGVFLIDGEESVTWQLANGVRSETYRGVIAPFGQHSFECTVEPGRYYIGILENSGNAVEYDLQIDAEPTASEFFNCQTPTLGAGPADGLRTRGVPH